MVIPRMIVRIGDLGPNNLDHPCPGLDEPARQQAALPKSIPAISIAHLRGLLRQVERLSRASRYDQIQSPSIVIIKVVTFDGLLDVRHRLLDGLAQSRASLKPKRKHAGRLLQIVHLEAL